MSGTLLGMPVVSWRECPAALDCPLCLLLEDSVWACPRKVKLHSQLDGYALVSYECPHCHNFKIGPELCRILEDETPKQAAVVAPSLQDVQRFSTPERSVAAPSTLVIPTGPEPELIPVDQVFAWAVKNVPRMITIQKIPVSLSVHKEQVNNEQGQTTDEVVKISAAWVNGREKQSIERRLMPDTREPDRDQLLADVAGEVEKIINFVPNPHPRVVPSAPKGPPRNLGDSGHAKEFAGIGAGQRVESNRVAEISPALGVTPTQTLRGKL